MQLLSDLSGFDSDIIKDLRSKFEDVWDDSISGKLEAELSEHKVTCKERLLEESPFRKHEVALLNAERNFRHFGGSEKAIYEDINNYSSLCPKVDGRFWLDKRKLSLTNKSESQLENNNQGPRLHPMALRRRKQYPFFGNNTDTTLYDVTGRSTEVSKQDTAIRRNIQEAWRKDYEKLQLEWELNEIESLRNQLLKDYTDLLENIREISKSLNALGLETGFLWDLSIGSLSKQDISVLLKWAEYLRGDKGIEKLCDLMGKMNQESHSHEIRKIQTTRRYEIKKPDINSKEEITGIKLGNDLENIIPQELSFLTDPEISILFDLKFVENRLMCFEKKGIQLSWEEENIEEEVHVSQLDKRGPIIVCVDTSGSMKGSPETIAKALTLILATQAANQKRPCYLVNFSASIETIDFQPPKGISDLICFLQKSFYGGTDVAPALYEAIRMMQVEEYSKSDLLVISDFVLSIDDDSFRESLNRQREKGNRFYALSIGQFRIDQVDDLFDFQWNYDSNTGTISQLNNVLEFVTKHR